MNVPVAAWGGVWSSLTVRGAGDLSRVHATVADDPAPAGGRLHRDRKVWVADSFEGVPSAGAGSHPLDVELGLHDKNDVLAVSEECVRENFRRYDLLDDQVGFLSGWFSETLPSAPLDRLAVIRLDGDLHRSTTDALVHLYPRLSPGGFVIVDDYGIPACAAAVHEFRDRNRITDPIRFIDPYSIYWRRTG